MTKNIRFLIVSETFGYYIKKTFRVAPGWKEEAKKWIRDKRDYMIDYLDINPKLILKIYVNEPRNSKPYKIVHLY